MGGHEARPYGDCFVFPITWITLAMAGDGGRRTARRERNPRGGERALQRGKGDNYARISAKVYAWQIRTGPTGHSDDNFIICPVATVCDHREHAAVAAVVCLIRAGAI